MSLHETSSTNTIVYLFMGLILIEYKWWLAYARWSITSLLLILAYVSESRGTITIIATKHKHRRWFLPVLTLAGANFDWCWLWPVLNLTGVDFDRCWIWPVLTLTGADFDRCWLWLVLTGADFDQCWLGLMLTLTGANFDQCWLWPVKFDRCWLWLIMT